MGGGGSGSMFGNFTKNWKVAEALASSGLSTVFPNAVSDSTAKAALDPLNIGGMSNPEEAESLPTPKTVTTTTRDLEAEAAAQAQAEADRMKKRKGYKSTVLTSMGGDLSTPSTLKQTLGGV